MMIGDGDDHQQQPGSPPRSLPPLPPPGEDLLARFHYLKSTLYKFHLYIQVSDGCTECRQTDRQTDKQTDRQREAY